MTEEDDLVLEEIADFDASIVAGHYENWSRAWDLRALPLDLQAPTLKTFVAGKQSTQPSRSIPQWLDGKSVRKVPSSECSCLEIACGFSDADDLTVLMARVACYMTPLAVFEAFDAAHDLARDVLASHAKRATSNRNLADGCKLMLAALAQVMDEYTLAFFAHFLFWSLRRDEIHNVQESAIGDHLRFWGLFHTGAQLAALSAADIADEAISDTPPEDESPSSMTEEDALLMVQPLYWIDRSRFARADTRPMRKDPADRAFEPVVETYRRLPLRQDISREQRASAASLVQRVGIERPTGATRAQIQHLLQLLEFEFGVEGAKRYAERSYHSFNTAGDAGWSLFWVSFRTFIDLDKVNRRGQAFNIPHFLGRIRFVNDGSGPRVIHMDGASISMPLIIAKMRPDSGGL